MVNLDSSKDVLATISKDLMYPDPLGLLSVVTVLLGPSETAALLGSLDLLCFINTVLVGVKKNTSVRMEGLREENKFNVGISNGLSLQRASGRPQYCGTGNPSVFINSFCGKRQRSGKFPMYHPPRRASSRSAQGHLRRL